MVLGILIGLELLFMGVLWYFALPALSLSSFGFLFFLLLAFIFLIIDIAVAKEDADIFMIGSIITLIVIFFAAIIGIICSPLFFSHSWATIYSDNAYESIENISEYPVKIELDNGEIKSNGFSKLSRDMADKLIIRKMGSLKGNMVSQFNADESYVSNFNGKPYRIAPLKHASFFKYLNNKEEGIPAYVYVDMYTNEVEIKYLEEGIKYSPSDYFGRDLKRHLRFEYPTYIFEKSSFEIDENGHPYWITPVVEYKIGLWQGKDIKSIIITDAVNGKCKEYSLEDVPEWVDNVYPSSLILKQYDWKGMYSGGFWNSQFGQVECIATTEGYNYVPDNNDIWIYTGITSVVADESNIGFILVNKRTKDTIYYEYPGAEEFSAMESAEGAIQQYGYKAEFPVLLNIYGEPTYYMALKDDGGLIKAYGLVNVADYQKVIVNSSFEKTIIEYLQLIGKEINNETINLNDNLTEIKDKNVEMIDVNGIVEKITSADINGTTYFYLKLIDNTQIYKISILDIEKLIFIEPGEEITLSAEKTENEIVNSKIK